MFFVVLDQRCYSTPYALKRREETPISRLPSLVTLQDYNKEIPGHPSPGSFYRDRDGPPSQISVHLHDSTPVVGRGETRRTLDLHMTYPHPPKKSLKVKRYLLRPFLSDPGGHRSFLVSVSDPLVGPTPDFTVHFRTRDSGPGSGSVSPSTRPSGLPTWDYPALDGVSGRPPTDLRRRCRSDTNDFRQG